MDVENLGWIEGDLDCFVNLYQTVAFTVTLESIRGGCTLSELQLLLAQNVNGHGIEIL